MFASLFFKGSLIGLSIALPIGPVGILCMQHSLYRGLLAGLIAGLGAALADTCFGCMAIFGVSLLSNIIAIYRVWFEIIGSLILWCIGIKVFKSKPKKMIACQDSLNYYSIFFSTFILTLTNPLIFLCFSAIYASLGLTFSDQEVFSSITLTLGIFVGSIFSWSAVNIMIYLIGRKFPFVCSPLFNRISGGILTGCGCLTGLSVLKQLLFFL